MSLSNPNNRNDYTGTGAQSVYPYTFRIFQNSDLLVTKRDTAGVEVTLVLTTDYTVTGAGASGGGNITLVAGNLPADYHLTIRRVLPLTQLTDIHNQGQFFAATHEDQFDRAAMIAQQQQDEINRCVQLPESVDVSVTSPNLPQPAGGKFFRWNAGATALENVTALVSGAYAFVAGNGLLAQTAADTATPRTLLAGVGLSVTDPAGTAADPKYSLDLPLCQGRLTLSTTLPVTAADQLAKTTVYLLPYKGSRAATYVNATGKWLMLTLPAAGASVAVPATTNMNYDVFLKNPTTLVLSAAWSTDILRATALIAQDGVFVNSLGELYVGTIRTTGVSGQTEDSEAKRYVWNYHNRVPRSMKVIETTNSWTYDTAAFRQANAAAGNQLDYIVGVSEDAVVAEVLASAAHSNNTGFAGVGIGLDSTTVNSAFVFGGLTNDGGQHPRVQVSARLRGYPGLGRHFLAWLEYSSGASATFYGDDGGSVVQSGMTGEVMA